jgi:mono/diheme cytochrome c family protein
MNACNGWARRVGAAAALFAVMSCAAAAMAADAKQTFIDNCGSCHGDDAKGLKDLGVNLTASDFVKQMKDTQFADFLMIGRQPAERGSKTGQLMPAFDYLTPEETAAVIAFVRQASR